MPTYLLHSARKVGRCGQDAFCAGIIGAPSKTLVSNGYSFRILATQGGFTIIASPVNYQHSGIMTFKLNRNGVLYQQDFGPQTADATASVTADNHTDGWAKAE